MCVLVTIHWACHLHPLFTQTVYVAHDNPKCGALKYLHDKQAVSHGMVMSIFILWM